MLQIQPRPDRDGHSSEELLRLIEDTKRRANDLFAAGYIHGAMRKYVRATYLAKDGEEKEVNGRIPSAWVHVASHR